MTAVLQTDPSVWTTLCTCVALWGETTGGFQGWWRDRRALCRMWSERDSDTVHRRHGDQLQARATAESGTVVTDSQVDQDGGGMTGLQDIVDSTIQSPEPPEPETVALRRSTRVSKPPERYVPESVNLHDRLDDVHCFPNIEHSSSMIIRPKCYLSLMKAKCYMTVVYCLKTKEKENFCYGYFYGYSPFVMLDLFLLIVFSAKKGDNVVY